MAFERAYRQFFIKSIATVLGYEVSLCRGQGEGWDEILGCFAAERERRYQAWLALEQAFRYANGGLRVLLLCYNIALADQLSALVAKRKFEIGEVIVRSWAGLA